MIAKITNEDLTMSRKPAPQINTDDIPIPPWITPRHKVTKAFTDGEIHALNHWHNEDPNPNWLSNVKSWSSNPYTKDRPATYYSWQAGFCEKWAELVRAND